MRGLILGLAVGLAVLLTAGEGRAGYYSGQKLNEVCNNDSLVSVGLCFGYILGVYDAGKVLDEATDKRQWQSGFTSCVPDGVKPGQLKEVVSKWLQQHPENWHYRANSLVAAALEWGFPCR